MPETRKLVRDSLFALLSSSGSTGFNASYAAAIAGGSGGSYPNAESVVIDWSPGTPGNTTADPKQFFFGQVDPSQLDADQVLKYPGVAIYTTVSEIAPPGEREMPRKFSGNIMSHLDWFLKHRDGAEKDDTESTADAIEDAVLECLNASAGSIRWNGDFRCERPPVELLPNGWLQRIPMVMTFFVSV